MGQICWALRALGVLDDLSRNLTELYVAVLRPPAELVERRVGIDAVAGHQHSLGLFDGAARLDCLAQLAGQLDRVGVSLRVGDGDRSLTREQSDQQVVEPREATGLA